MQCFKGIETEYLVTDVAQKLHLHLMILVIDGVNERVLSVRL